jgi:mannose-6-phosphate isomerase-like protein (cupin superfamily)
MPMRASASNQAFFVIDGEGLVTLAGMHIEIFPGTVIKVPCGVLYELRNTGGVPLRMLAIHDPPLDPTTVWDCEEPMRTRLAAGAKAADSIKTAEVLATGTVAWKAFEAVGVRGYELKPMILGSELTDAYSIDLMRVTGGGFSAAHTDQGRHAFFIIRGQGRLTADGGTFDFRQDDIVKVPQGSVHELHNHTMGQLEFLAIYDPPRRRKTT